jgi:sirohydrochlorin cobaltochelatase
MSLHFINIVWRNEVEMEALILVGHGAGEDALKSYDKILDIVRKTVPDSYLIMLHGHPSIEDIAAEISAKGIKKAVLVPLLLAKGHHLEHNIVSPGSSIQLCLEKAGISVSAVDKGLLEYEEVIECIAGHIIKTHKRGM